MCISQNVGLPIPQDTLFKALASTNEGTRRVILNSHTNPDRYKDNLGKAVIYYEALNFQSIAEKEAYMVIALDYKMPPEAECCIFVYICPCISRLQGLINQDWYMYQACQEYWVLRQILWRDYFISDVNQTVYNCESNVNHALNDLLVFYWNKIRCQRGIWTLITSPVKSRC